MADEALTLGGLALHTGAYRLTALSMAPPAKRPEWAENTDGDGSGLVRDPLFENRVIEATVEVRAASKNAGQDAVQVLVGELEEADRIKGGVPLVWTPAESATALTFYVLSGEVRDFPMTVESGYYQGVFTLNLVLTCRPYGYEPEVSGPTVTTASPVVILTVPSVGGDVPAEARLRMKDMAGQTRDFAVWGLENVQQGGHDLLLTTSEMHAFPDYSGTLQTRAGSVSAQPFRGVLGNAPVAVCSSLSQPHLGTYRVFARYWPTGVGVRLRLSWQEGDGPFTSNPYVAPPAENAWCESDLGIINVSGALLGTQRWHGLVEALSDVEGDTVDIDYLELIPAGEGFGKARRPQRFVTSTVFSARDQFNQVGGSLTSKVAQTGGAWAAAGDATDYVVEDTGHTVQRTAVSDADINTGRYMVLPVSMGTQVVQVDFKHNRAGIVSPAQESGVLARYSDASNWLQAVTRTTSGGKFEVRKRVAGTVTDLFSSDLIPFQPANAWYTFRLVVDAAGRWAVWYFPQGGGANSLPVAQGQDAALVAGTGALGAGVPGFYDVNTGSTATVRSFDNFVAFVPPSETVCYANRAIEFRHDETVREDAAGFFWGQPPRYRGSPFFLPPSGAENRTTRIAVMARRNDIETLPVGASVSDSLQVQVLYTPRRLVVP